MCNPQHKSSRFSVAWTHGQIITRETMQTGLLKAIKFFRSQRILAEALGIKQQAISNWLNRESKIPYLQVIKIFCLTKGTVSVEELAPDEKELNQSFTELLQDCIQLKLGTQSNIEICAEQNDPKPLILESSTDDEYDPLAFLLPLYKHAFLELIHNEEENTMTREYSKISPQFWVGKIEREILKLGVESRLLAFYLMTCPHSNMIGIYYLPVAYIVHDTKIDRVLIDKALKELIEMGFCSYDFTTDYVWVHEIAKYQVSDHLEEKDKRGKAINDIFRTLPDLIFLNEFYEKYQDVFHLSARKEFFDSTNDDYSTVLATSVVKAKHEKRHKHEDKS